MSSPREAAVSRKELLVARARLQRLQGAAQLDALRANLRWPRAAAAVAASPPGRSLLFGLLMAAVGAGRVGRLIRLAGGVVVAAKVATLLYRRADSRAVAPHHPT